MSRRRVAMSRINWEAVVVGAGGLLMTSHDAVDCSSEAEVEATGRGPSSVTRPDQTPAAEQHVLRLGI